LDFGQRGVQAPVEGKPRLARTGAPRRSPDKLDSEIALDRRQRTADGLQRAVQVAGRTRQASFLDDGDEGLEIPDPVHAHSPGVRKSISQTTTIIPARGWADIAPVITATSGRRAVAAQAVAPLLQEEEMSVQQDALVARRAPWYQLIQPQGGRR